ncbi:MgtC/SapB family protein [Clostridium sp. BJN0001]|uniref:MgtC/SapB family protein n=1 Tax=Clostridium sp. BJN0001 TaxID=2930219 RepID=UPI001FD014DE|nr:MgtC/SapB family protein [Clostridium sp. BJN0001]
MHLFIQNIHSYLQSINTLSIIVRLMLATICGGIIGAERGRKKRPAGFRTHILVCIGATMVMITGQYMYDVLGMQSDPSRIGAQVVSGIGFLGAGTILVVGKNEVKGLTTAACLWSCACIGLAIGIGFYEGAVISCIFLYFVVTLLHKLDLFARIHSKTLDIYVTLRDIKGVTNFLNIVKSDGTTISNIEVINRQNNSQNTISLNMTLTFLKKHEHSEYILDLHKIDGVINAGEIE